MPTFFSRYFYARIYEGMKVKRKKEKKGKVRWDNRKENNVKKEMKRIRKTNFSIYRKIKQREKKKI